MGETHYTYTQSSRQVRVRRVGLQVSSAEGAALIATESRYATRTPQQESASPE